VADRFFGLNKARRGNISARSATEEQRSSNEKAAPPEEPEQFVSSGGVVRSLSRNCGTGMLVAHALPSAPNCSGAANPYL